MAGFANASETKTPTLTITVNAAIESFMACPPLIFPDQPASGRYIRRARLVYRARRPGLPLFRNEHSACSAGLSLSTRSAAPPLSVPAAGVQRLSGFGTPPARTA